MTTDLVTAATPHASPSPTPPTQRTYTPAPARVNPLEQPLAAAQQDRGDGEVQLIDEAGAEILLDRVRSAADAHVFAVGGFLRPVQGLVDTAGDEVEGRAAGHFEGRARVVG